MFLSSRIPKRHARRNGDREDGFAVLGAFNLAGRTALVSGAEPDTVRAVASALREAGAHVFASDAPVASLLEAAPPTPGGVDVLVHCCDEPEKTAALARCVDIRLNVVRVPVSAEHALSAALGAVVFLARRRRSS